MIEAFFIGALIVGFGIGLLTRHLIRSSPEPEQAPDIDPVTASRMQSLATSLHLTQAAWLTERDMMAATLHVLQKRAGQQ